MKYTIGGVSVSFPYKAYPSQVAMMSKIISALQKGQNSLLESPTGSGKSLALLCAALAWQETESKKARAYNEALEAGLIQPESLHDEEEEEDEETEYIALTQNQGGFIPGSSSPQAKRHCPETIGEILVKKKSVPKIYFGTRTHKQITQIIKELKKTDYKNVPMTVLGSREHSCVNPVISKMKNKTEGCRELTDRRNVEGTGCHYMSNVKKKCGSHYSLSALRGTTEAWDIEDLVKFGKKHKTCPYFTSRELMPKSKIIFCPYNYLIEPMIRKSLSINLKKHILIFDEAHNIEDSARDAASFKTTQDDLIDAMNDCTNVSKLGILPSHHDKLAKVCSNLSSWMDSWSSSLNDYSDFKSSSKIWTGTEILAVLSIQELNRDTFPSLAEILAAVITEQQQAMSDYSENSNAPPPPAVTKRTLDVLEGFFLVLNYLFMQDTRHRDDYRVAITKTQGLKKSRKFMPGDWLKKSSGTLGFIYTLQFWCLNPALSFIDIKESVRSVVLTSGTLSPMVSFATELDVKFPITLEAAHVIDKKQVWISTISKGPQGGSLNATFKNTESFSFQDEIGRLLLQICIRIKSGGILMFLPSYRLLNTLSERWKSTGLWNEIENHKLILSEPKTTDEFENVIKHYNDIVEETENSSGITGAVFMAVCRGKVSEGLDFADNKARAVICVGIPFPNTKDVQVDLKKKFNDSRRSSSVNVLSGNDWYEIQAFRALNQALGRCIRHKRDWGAIIMVDDRYSRNQRYINGLSKWVRSGVSHFHSANDLLGGLDNFYKEMLVMDQEFIREDELLKDEKAAVNKEEQGSKKQVVPKINFEKNPQNKPKLDELVASPNFQAFRKAKPIVYVSDSDDNDDFVN